MLLLGHDKHLLFKMLRDIAEQLNHISYQLKLIELETRHNERE